MKEQRVKRQRKTKKQYSAAKIICKGSFIYNIRKKV